MTGQGLPGSRPGPEGGRKSLTCPARLSPPPLSTPTVFGVKTDWGTMATWNWGSQELGLSSLQRAALVHGHFLSQGP